MLPASRSWVLQRPVPNFPYVDAMGGYPLFASPAWSALEEDLEDMGDDLVSLSLVADPFGHLGLQQLERCFPDVCIPFKQHFVIDVSESPMVFVSSHHRRNAKKAFRHVEVEVTTSPLGYLEDWISLYGALIERHNITGIAAFPRESLEEQLQVPGIVAFRAVSGGRTVGMLLWYVHGEVAYYHLGAHSDEGYDMGSSFALFWSAIEYFKEDGLAWLNLGGGAGVGNDGTDGLSRFKAGWSTETRSAFFCGRVFDRAKYAKLIEASRVSGTSYFPAYRYGEFR